MNIVITDRGSEPETPETQRMSKLIGRAITRIELRTSGAIYLEFDPHGSITLQPLYSLDVNTSIAPIGPEIQ